MSPDLHITDTLDLGGYERVAVNLVNELPRDRYAAHLCTTRRDGPLAGQVAPGVTAPSLGRTRTFDAGAVRRLAAFIRATGIRILHAHGPSLFLARAAALLPPYPALVWHAHCGRLAAEDRAAWPYRLAARGIAGVIAVNQPLVEWPRRRLRVPAARSWYVPNIVAEQRAPAEAPELPGTRGPRIVAVANLRPEKDHFTLLRAFAMVARALPDAHLLLVGASGDAALASGGCGAEAAGARNGGAHLVPGRSARTCPRAVRLRRRGAQLALRGAAHGAAGVRHGGAAGGGDLRRAVRRGAGRRAGRHSGASRATTPRWRRDCSPLLRVGGLAGSADSLAR